VSFLLLLGTLLCRLPVTSHNSNITVPWLTLTYGKGKVERRIFEVNSIKKEIINLGKKIRYVMSNGQSP
jgi:hypothetical protein